MVHFPECLSIEKYQIYFISSHSSKCAHWFTLTFFLLRIVCYSYLEYLCRSSTHVHVCMHAYVDIYVSRSVYMYHCFCFYEFNNLSGQNVCCLFYLKYQVDNDLSRFFEKNQSLTGMSNCFSKAIFTYQYSCICIQC